MLCSSPRAERWLANSPIHTHRLSGGRVRCGRGGRKSPQPMAWVGRVSWICIVDTYNIHFNTTVILWCLWWRVHLGSSLSLTCAGYSKGEEIYKHTHASMCCMVPTQVMHARRVRHQRPPAHPTPTSPMHTQPPRTRVQPGHTTEQQTTQTHTGAGWQATQTAPSLRRPRRSSTRMTDV